jgi:glyoxylase-like metal-dependent hydrolase (beta-lactamase superfamily II)
MKTIVFAGLAAAVPLLVQKADPGAAPSDYRIEAIRYATIPDFPVAGLVMGAPEDERMDIAAVFWLIRGDGRIVLFDTGFHHEEWFDRFTITGYMRADEALAPLGVSAADVTDIIISHAHWDHMGGIDLFPNATLWIQREEFAYYTGPAWQEDGRHGGIDPADIVHLVRRNTAGQVRLIDGDDVEILPGVRVFTGGRHTYASQYIRVDGDPPYVLASDNCYLYRNLREHAPVATFTPADRPSNLEALDRMVKLAGSADRVVPGHDPSQFTRFPTDGRVARIR